MKKVFLDTKKQKSPHFDRDSTRPSNHAQITSVSPPRNPIRPSRPVQFSSFDMKLETIEHKLHILAVQTEKVALGQAVIGRQLEQVMTFLSVNRGSSVASGGGCDSVNLGDASAYSRSNNQKEDCTPSNRSDTTTFDSAHVDGESSGRNDSDVRQIDGTYSQGRGSKANNDSGRSGVENSGDFGVPEGFLGEELKEPKEEKLNGVQLPLPTTLGDHEGTFDGHTFDQRALPRLQQPEYPDEDSEDEGKFKMINQFRLVDKDGSGTLDLAEVYIHVHCFLCLS